MIGTGELFVIGVIVFFIFGANALPKLAKGAGEAVRELRGIKRTVTDASDELADGVRDVDQTVRDTVRDAEREIDP